MRNIKFRAWDKDYEKMTYFDDEDYEYKPPFVFRLDQVFKKDSNYDDYEDFEYNDVTDNVEVMQYTGLKDKNGKEIYEGDIVKVKLYKGEEEKYFIGKVEYFGSNFLVDADNNSEYHVYDLDGFGIDYRYNLEDCEVIGNIYDNPELLEEIQNENI